MAPDEIDKLLEVKHNGFHVLLEEPLYFDAAPYSVHQDDSFPTERPVQVESLYLQRSLNGYQINAYGKRRKLDGSLSVQYFAGCLIRWSQIPTEVRQAINRQGGPDVRKWWRA